MDELTHFGNCTASSLTVVCSLKSDCCCCLPNELWRIENTLSAAADDGWIRATFRKALAHTGISALWCFHHSQGSICGDTSSAAAKYVGNYDFIPSMASESKHGKLESELKSLLVGLSSDKNLSLSSKFHCFYHYLYACLQQNYW